MDLKSKIRDIPDFPQPGIIFKDITPLFQDAEAFKYAIDSLADKYRNAKIDVIVGIEARGFMVGAPLAYLLGVGFVPMRKPGKLPADVISASYDLEYGSNTLELHRDAIKPGQRVLLVDDLLATGGTMAAAVKLVEQLGGEVAGISFLIELSFLKGRTALASYDVFSLMSF
ncbi:MAG TPA: adenine phosphoribosyltransferase [Clostridia bacterium]|jgi:adenine phosphoribosyltransferase|nr:adenine phosphoribosyltransferase [Clostridia bacterium]